MPLFSMQDWTFAGGAFRSRPMYSRKSALPQTLEADLLPCLATLAEAADATMAAAVLMLNDLIESPPVPQVSMSDPLTWGVILVEWFLNEIRIDLSSSDVSPFIVRATRKAATAVSGTIAPRIASRAWVTSAADRSVFATSFFISGRKSVETLIFSP
jgi:hypothetical protein